MGLKNLEPTVEAILGWPPTHDATVVLSTKSLDGRCRRLKAGLRATAGSFNILVRKSMRSVSFHGDQLVLSR